MKWFSEGNQGTFSGLFEGSLLRHEAADEICAARCTLKHVEFGAVCPALFSLDIGKPELEDVTHAIGLHHEIGLRVVELNEVSAFYLVARVRCGLQGQTRGDAASL